MILRLDKQSKQQFDSDEPRLLTIAKAADFFGWSCDATLRRRRRRKQFPEPLNPGKVPLIWDERVLEAWAAHVANSGRDYYPHWAESVFGKRLLKQVATEYAATTAEQRPRRHRA
jgi:hypothetical protein